MPTVGDHYRPRADADLGDASTADHRASVYRVVGASEGVTLLRVTDADGRRAHTGELIRVSAEALTAEFERAEDPDAGLSPVRGLRNALSGLYWQFRKFL